MQGFGQLRHLHRETARIQERIREAFEVVLFYQALWLQNESNHHVIIGGFLAGVLALLAATYGVSFLQLGIFNPILNFSIAVAKAGLVAWFFMHLRAATGIVRLFAGAALLWLIS